MVIPNYSEFVKKILWWLNLRWVGLAMLGGVFFKFFYGLQGPFLMYIFLALLFLYLVSFSLWFFVKTGRITSEKFILTYADVIFLLDLGMIFYLCCLVYPLAEVNFLPLGQLINASAFLYFLVITASGVILGLSESVMVSTIASVLFWFQKYNFAPAALITKENQLWGLENVAIFYLGVFLIGFLTIQAESKKSELDETNFELTQKIRDLEGRRKELITLERKASLHQLAVSLNHEINNPLTSVLGNSQFYYDKLGRLSGILDSFKESVLDSLAEARKIKELLRKIRKITEPIVSEYIPGVNMIDIDKAVLDKQSDQS
jgi:signal transduction histidine kinase